MRKRSLIGGAIMATVMTLISVGGATAQSPQSGDLFHAARTDVIMVVSDLVDLESAIKVGDAEERERRKALHVGRASKSSGTIPPHP